MAQMAEEEMFRPILVILATVTTVIVSTGEVMPLTVPDCL